MEGHGEMVIFSVRGGEEEDDSRDESSSFWPKRQRATTSSTSSSQQRRQRPRHADPNPVYNFDSDYEEEETRQDEGEEEQRASVDDGSEEEEEEEGQNQVSTTELPSMSSLRSARSDSIAMTITLTDPEVLDCPICFEPFTIPVFQCENGHTACSSCCIKIAHKCPSCALPTGYNRCRAIEKVLESVRVNCRYTRYGCKESFSYDKKHNHDKTCIYAPCLCPQAGCNFIDSSKHLYEHYSRKHTSSRLGFNYNATFPIYVTTRDTFFVLQEENEGVLFLFYSKAEVLGHTIKICCLGPSTMNGRYIFELTARTEGSNLRFQSIAKNIRCRVDNHPSTGFLLIPIGFFDSYVQNRLDLCIWRHGSCPVEFRTSIPKSPSGCLKQQKCAKNMYATGMVKMVRCETEISSGKNVKSLGNRSGENGCFVLWQMLPGMWSLELAVGGNKVIAGSDGKTVWRHTPWLGTHAAKGPQRPLRRIIQGLDPKSTASLFAKAQCLGEKQIGDDDCFVLKVAADREAVVERSDGPAEVLRHVLYGYFCQKSGLLIYLEDSHLTRVQTPENDTIYWETTIGSSIGDYRDVDGVLIAHQGRSIATVFRFEEETVQHSRTRMEELWRIDDAVFNVPGLSMDHFIPPADISEPSP